MFGISLTEIAMIALVTLIVVGPQKLPRMLRTVGEWLRKLRRLTSEVRAQTGIDDILREEGIEGGLSELRGIIRGDVRSFMRAQQHEDDPYPSEAEVDLWREYPPEGPDAHGAMPDDLIDDAFSPPPTPATLAPEQSAEHQAESSPGAPEATPAHERPEPGSERGV